MTERNWTPKRSGTIYCAPACGGNCTWAAHQQAVRNAARLVKECGPGYTPRVHENLGWHFAAMSSCGQIYVSDYGDKGTARYSALFGEPNSHSGRWIGRGETAKEAIAQVIAAARSEMDGIAEMLGAIRQTGNK